MITCHESKLTTPCVFIIDSLLHVSLLSFIFKIVTFPPDSGRVSGIMNDDSFKCDDSGEFLFNTFKISSDGNGLLNFVNTPPLCVFLSFFHSLLTCCYYSYLIERLVYVTWTFIFFQDYCFIF